jgi:hypothetical protein
VKNERIDVISSELCLDVVRSNHENRSRTRTRSCVGLVRVPWHAEHLTYSKFNGEREKKKKTTKNIEFEKNESKKKEGKRKRLRQTFVQDVHK